MTITLDTLKPAKGAAKKALRVGRGRASGAGKTCNRGHNGEGQRSGCSSKRGFEGGQMPLYRRVPKFRTFPQPNKKEWLELSLSQIQVLAGESKEVNYQQLIAMGTMSRRYAGVRILGSGEITTAVKVQAHHATASATAKLEAAGCTLELLDIDVAPLFHQATMIEIA